MDALLDRLAEEPIAQKRNRRDTSVRERGSDETGNLGWTKVMEGPKGSDHTKEMEEKLTDLYEGLRDGYHKECVKVYRNLQAAFTEEKEKQTKHLSEEVARLEGKNRRTLFFSIMACVIGLGNLVLLVLMALKVL